MAYEVELLEAATATGPGGAKETENIDRGTVQLNGTFVATVQIEGSNDGSTWAQIGTDLTTSGQFLKLDTELPVKKIRANVSAFTSGSINAVMIGSTKNN